MSAKISAPLREVLTRSLPMVRQHKSALIGQMARSLSVDGTPAPESGQIARTLVELLFDQTHDFVAGTEQCRLHRLFDEHRAIGVEARHYSRFGDALVPALTDLLGPNVPRQVPAAWCDAFWAIVRKGRAAARLQNAHA